MKEQPKFKRRIKLIKPRLQVRLILAFSSVAALSLLLQYLLVAQRLSWTAARLPIGGQYLMEEIPRILISVLAISFAVLFPLTFAIGVIVTFRVAGPIYRFETYLTQVSKGEDPGVLRLREGDELQNLCNLINTVRQENWGKQAETQSPTDTEADESLVAAVDASKLRRVS